MQSRHFVVLIRRAAALMLSMTLGSCGGDAPTELASRTAAAMVMAADAPQVAVTAVVKVGETRVGRTVFDYVLQVTFRNNGTAALSDIQATLTAAGAGATIVDASVQFGAIGAGASVTPADTITIRQDRSVPFNPSALVWNITASGTPPAVPGILLPGAPDSSAVDAIPEYKAARTEADLATGIKAGGSMKYYLTQLQAIIADDATVGQVNSALSGAGARLVWSMRKNRAVTIQVADQGSLAALQQKAAALALQPAFDHVSVYYLSQPADLPVNIDAQMAIAPDGPLLHQLGARLPAAWNAKAAIATSASPVVIVVDFFGQGTPTQLVSEIDPAFPVYQTSLDCFPPNPDDSPCSHGYHVLGILAGSYGGAFSETGRVTGSLPAALPLTVIDLTKPPARTVGMEWDEVRELIARRIRATPDRRFVLNFSLQYCHDTGGCSDLTIAESDAIAWRVWARGIHLDDGSVFDWDGHVFSVSAAGNNSSNEVAHFVKFDARIASWMNAAALLPPLAPKPGKATLPQLANALVVEARDTETNGRELFATCRVGAYSNINGTIAGVGGGLNKVYSFTGPASVGRMNGTSMAAPQVAGLVASMMAIRPQWNLSDIKYQIESVRTHTENCPGDAPMIDAYAALLALDRSYNDAPVRTALLKPAAVTVGAGEQFRYDDALLFLRAFFPIHYGLPARPVTPDFSRFDLNGDGYTGGLLPAAFPLRMSRSNAPFSPQSVDAYPRGMPLSTPIAESGATDFEILCYYVNSALMADSERARVDGELARISAVRPNDPRISCVERVVTLQVNGYDPNWTGLPALITLSNFSGVFPATPAGNSPTCTNQGQPAGERGAPLFSGAVPSFVPILAAIDVAGVPTPLAYASNRRNCSSFYATDGQHTWVNATARAVFGFGGSVVSDWEFQVRYASGDANGVGKKCTVGTVPGSNNFAPAFEAASCSHSDSVKGKISQ